MPKFSVAKSLTITGIGSPVKKPLFLRVFENAKSGAFRPLPTPTQEPRKVRFRGVQLEVYRFIYCVAEGVALPWSIVVHHRCHNRTCINPHHLTRGDRRDNKHDDWTRAAYGVDHALLPRE